jgi:single-stranded DNA-binding protein
VDVNEAAASSIIERACSAIDNEKLDPTTAVALWHEIRAYRRIKERLAQKVRQGARAAVAVPDTVEKVGGPAPE